METAVGFSPSQQNVPLNAMMNQPSNIVWEEFHDNRFQDTA